MNSKFFFVKKISIVLILMFFIISCINTRRDMDAPVAKKIPKELTIHGDTRIDNYLWLNDREDPEVIEYLKAENKYTDVKLAHTQDLQENLFNEIVGRIKQDDASVPYFKNGFYYYTRYEEDKEYPLYCRKKGSLEAPEEILLNVNEMAKDHGYYNVRGLTVSTNNQLLAFGVDEVGRRKYEIRVKDLSTGEIIADGIKNTTGSAAWANDNRTIFYTLKDETLRPYLVMRHQISQNVAKDKQVYQESDSSFYTYAYKSKSDKYIIIGSSHTLSSEFRFLDADKPTGKFKVIQHREMNHEYNIDHYADNFYILTNWNARNFKLMKTKIHRTSKKYWKEVIPHREDVLLENFEVFKNFLVLEERQTALTQIRIINWQNNESHYLDFGEPVYLAYISDNMEFDTDILRYNYTSLTTPNSTYDYDMIKRDKHLMKQQEIVGNFKPENYRAERLWAPASDGTKIPISLVYRKDLKEENMPLLLYGYGSYGYSINPSFKSNRLSLLDRGVAYGIAHIRGGQEMGRYWYEDGKLLKKKNTFTDFIDCGQFLVDQKYTEPQKFFAMGGSAGGLLMGAIINMKPELFKGIISGVPFVDVITTMLDESIPLTTSEYDEWGNPNDKTYYDYMLSYSPYDQVKAQNYPAMLVTTGLHDSQVQYWEPAKWVAKLRDMKTDDNLLLLKTDMEAGHSGTSGRFKRHRDTALEYAFILDQLD